MANPNIEKYVNENYAKLETYIDEVLNDKIVCGKYEKKSVERFIKLKEKYIYNEEEVKRVIKFFYLLNINIDNVYQRFNFLDFQVFWVANLYGLYKTPTERLFKRAYITVAKKNGKTLFNSCLALYSLIYDKQLDASVVLLASSRDQASIALNYTKSIIENSPELPHLTVQRNEIYYKYKNTTCKIQVKSADSNRIQGGSYTFSLIDEYAFHKNDELASRAYSASAARTNPLQVLITTAGYDKDKSPAYEMQESCKNILDNVVQDDTIFTCIYALDDPEKEIHQPEVYRKANPALGITVKTEFITALYKQSQTMPTFKTTFLTDNMNVWVDNKQQWLSDDVVKECMKKKKTIPKGADVYLGCDLSAVKDLTSIYALYYDDKNDEYIGDVYFIFPNIEENKIRKGSIDLGIWINEGYIWQTADKVITDDDVLAIIEDIAKKYNIVSVGIDPYMVQRLKLSIENNLGLTVNLVPQNIRHLSAPLKEIEKNIIQEKMYLPISPVLRWNFRNAVIWTDTNGNIKLMKNKGESIDGLIALNVAMHQYLAYNFDYNQVAYDEFINLSNRQN